MKKYLLLGIVLLLANSAYAAEIDTATLKNSIDGIWVIVAGALVFLMQAGFKCLEVGMVREKHINTVAMKNVIDWTVGSLVFFGVGFGLMFGHSLNGFAGIDLFWLNEFNIEGGSPLGAIFFMFQLAFVGTALTIVSGAMSERTGFIPYLTASVFIAAVIYPVFGHWAWGSLFFSGNGGWLADMGFLDFAGSTVVHSVGAWVSLAGLILLGPRIGRYNEDGSPRPLKPYNLAYAVLGLFLLWVGWWGFNGGSTLEFSNKVGDIILVTNAAGAAAGIVAYFHCKFFQRKDGIYEKLIGGALCGLVAITASPDIQTVGTAIIIGALAGVVHNISFELLIRKFRIDDAVGAIPVHGVGGVLGTLLVVIAPNGDFGDNSIIEQLGIQALGVAVCFVWTFSLGYALFFVLKKTVGLRVSPEEERRGISLFAVEVIEENEEENEEELRKMLEELGAE